MNLYYNNIFCLFSIEEFSNLTNRVIWNIVKSSFQAICKCSLYVLTYNVDTENATERI